MRCGMPFLSGLVYVGLCLARSRSYLLADGRVVVRGELLFRKWFLFVLCGVFGESKMIDISRSNEEFLHSILFTLFTWTTG